MPQKLIDMFFYDIVMVHDPESNMAHGLYVRYDNRQHMTDRPGRLPSKVSQSDSIPYFQLGAGEYSNSTFEIVNIQFT